MTTMRLLVISQKNIVYKDYCFFFMSEHVGHLIVNDAVTLMGDDAQVFCIKQILKLDFALVYVKTFPRTYDLCLSDLNIAMVA